MGASLRTLMNTSRNREASIQRRVIPTRAKMESVDTIPTTKAPELADLPKSRRVMRML